MFIDLGWNIYFISDPPINGDLIKTTKNNKKQKIDKWVSTSSSKPTGVNNCALIMREYSIVLHFRFKQLLPSCSLIPSPLQEQERKYKSTLELFHYIYISLLDYDIYQKFGFVYVNHVNEHKNFGTKSSQTKQRQYRYQNTLKPLCFEYRVLILDFIWSEPGRAKWLRDTLQSLNWILVDRRREDSYKSWLRI